MIRASSLLFALLLAAAPCIGRSLAAETLNDSGGTSADYLDARLARISAYHGRYSEAIARMDKALARSPNFASGYLIRAEYFQQAGRFADALNDLHHAEQFHPDTTQTRLARAVVAIRQHDAGSALRNIQEIPKLPMLTVWRNQDVGLSQHGVSYAFVYASVAEEMLGHGDEALDALKHELAFENDDPSHVLGEHCFLAAAVGLLDMAEMTCSEAIAKQDHDTGAFDSQGLTYLKMGKYRDAIRSYDKSLYNRPDLTVSLYGRGVAKHAVGDLAGGDADIAAAKRGEPDIASVMASLGVKAM